MGDGNRIEIGDRITNINLPLNMSDMIAKGIEQGRATSRDGSLEMNIDISMRLRIAEREGDGIKVFNGSEPN